MTDQDPYRPQMQPPPPAPQPAYGAPQPPQYPQPMYQQMNAQANMQYPAPYGFQPQWLGMAVPAPVMVDGFMLLHPRLKPIPSGPAIGSLPAGIAGILGALPGLISAAFNPWAGLTFFMFAALFGLGAVLLATYGLRRIKIASGGISGRGIAITGLILGLVALGLAVLTGVIALAVAL